MFSSCIQILFFTYLESEEAWVRDFYKERVCCFLRKDRKAVSYHLYHGCLPGEVMRALLSSQTSGDAHQMHIHTAVQACSQGPTSNLA